MKRIATFVLVTASIVCSSSRADVKLPSIISDHMVLQADASAPIWGWADPQEKVTVTFAGQTKSATADADGKWRVTLDPLPANAESRPLVVKGKNAVTVNDVLVGQVWLASGQSNMALQLNRARDAEQEAAAAKYPQLRMFVVKRAVARTPQTQCEGEWFVLSPETAMNLSAVAYFFGRELHQQLKTPVGMINSSVGGTDVAAWTSEATQRQDAELAKVFDDMITADKTFDPTKAKTDYDKRIESWKKSVAKAKAAQAATMPKKPETPVQPREDVNFPANLYNAMIAPLVPYAIRGVIWYQGEHNTSTEVKARRYYRQLPLLVEDWRKQWQAELPFAWVQLPNLDRVDSRPLVREAMLQTLKMPKTGMAVTIDIGEPADNHPKNKQDVGKRLAMWALGTVYGKPVAVSGPLPASNSIQGNEVTVKFTHTDGGLTAKGDKLKGFTIAGADKQWHPAEARISGDTVIVSSPDVAKPVAVRYAWANNPDCNLFNGAGLPASPFRTDDW